MIDGPYTGRWVEKKVTGRWARTEKYEVGQMANVHQYQVYLEGDPTYHARWGYIAVENALTNAPLACAECAKPVWNDDYLCRPCRSKL